MDKKALLEQIEKSVNRCRNCRLFQGTMNAVPGEGNMNSELVFVGEAPGAEEDKQGRPFVGRAGKLLEHFLKDIGYNREDVWIGNIVKHRPPENRDPLPDEIHACQGYLTAQLEAIDPKLVVTLGRFALNYFDKDGKISRDHGVLRNVGSRVILPLYHPAAALRNPSVMEELKADFKRIPDVLRTIKEKGLQKSVGAYEFQMGLGV